MLKNYSIKILNKLGIEKNALFVFYLIKAFLWREIDSKYKLNAETLKYLF